MGENSSNTSSSVKLFKYEGAEVRTVVIDGEVWFVAKDVCDILGLDNVSKAIQELDDDEKSSLTISKGTSPKGGNPNMNIISESGLYALVFKSRKPEAKKFTRWVTHEVLPQVMRTGKYSIGKDAFELDSESVCNILASLSILRCREEHWLAISSRLTDFLKLLPNEANESVKEHDDEFDKVFCHAVFDMDDWRVLEAIGNVAKKVISKKLYSLRKKIQMLSSISLA